MKKSDTMLHYLVMLAMFLLPWQTIWMYEQTIVHGSMWQYATLGFYASEIVLWVALAWWLISTIRQRSIRIKLNQINIIGLLAAILLTLKASSNIWIATQGLTWVLLALWVFLLLTHAKQAQLYLKTIACSLVIVAALGVLQFAQQAVEPSSLLGIAAQSPDVLGVPVVMAEGTRLLRAFGSFPHPNVFGGYMVLGIMLGLLFIRSQEDKWFGRVVYVMSLMGLLISFSRSAWIAYILLLASLCIYRKKIPALMSRISSLTIGIIAIFIIAYHPYILSRINTQQHIEQLSITQRTAGYAEALTLFKEAPLLGTGMHNYTVALRRLQTDLPGYALQPVHNVPLLLVVEWGIVGTLVLGAGCSFVLKSIRSKFNSTALLVVVLPILLLDHYLWSLYAGIMLMSLICAANVQIIEHKK